MIARIHRYGSDAPGLFSYLYGPGHKNEHTNPHMLGSAGGADLYGSWWAGDFAAEHMGANLSQDEARALGHLLQSDWRDHREDHVGARFAPSDVAHQSALVGSGAPMGSEFTGQRFVDPAWAPSVRNGGPNDPEFPGFGDGPHRKHVLHIVLSLGPDEGPLTDEQWSRVCHSYMARMGLESDGGQGHAWTAVHHGQSAGGNDHVHLVASMVSRDGGWWNDHYSFKRSREAANAVEDEFNLRPVQDRTRGQERPLDAGRGHESRGAKRRTAEDQAAGRQSMGERERLQVAVRAAAATSTTEREFIEACLRSGVRVRPRFAQGGTTKVIGYSAALRAGAGDGGETVWHGGGRLAKDLGLGQLRQRWGQSESDRLEALPLWQQAAGVAPQGDGTPGPRAWEATTQRVRGQADAAERMDPHDKRAWDHVRRDVAGQWAAVAQHGPKPYRGAAAQVSQAVHPTARGMTTPASGTTVTVSRQVRLLCRSMSRSDARSWLALIEQMRRTVEAIERAAEARREVRAAERIAAARREEMGARQSMVPRSATHGGQRVSRVARPSTRQSGAGLDR